MRHMSQTSPITVLYAVMVPHGDTYTPPPTAMTPPHSANMRPIGDESHEKQYESMSGSKFGGAVKRPGGDWT